MARIPLMVCLSIELLAPAIRLSKTFQSEDVDFVSVSMLLDQSKKQMTRLKQKDFKELPTVKRFLDNVIHDSGRYLFQDVPLKQFEIAKESVAKQKDAWLNLMSEAISMRLEKDESVVSKYATTVVNTERGGFVTKMMMNLLMKILNFTFYEQPLKKAGFQGGLSDLLDQWHSVVEYCTKYLNIKSNYKEVWHRIFESSKRGEWNLVLLLVELLFCLPVSNTKVERLFSLIWAASAVS